ncbi:MAG: FtsX-like permease family protein [Lachnospiraceae bacterium]|nr:FtsX-like permease family protein [Lachnospiraceae bacterium]
MFAKDTFRLIFKTKNRFFSLFMIVLIGVAFMMGLLSTRYLMEASVDRYADSTRLWDLQIYSSYGFDEGDVAALRGVGGVTEVFPSRFVDLLCESPDGHVAVTRAAESDRTLGQFELASGRLPERLDEILVLEHGLTGDHYALGTRLHLFREEDDLKDVLARTDYTVVGTVRTPDHLAKTLGTGLYRNLELGLIVYLPSQNFLADYYTTVYLAEDGLEALNAFSSAYKQASEDAKSDLEVFAHTQQDVLKSKILAKYQKEIDDGRAELEARKADGQAQLDEARVKLDDGNVQLVASETQLQTLKSALSEAEGRQAALARRVSAETGRSLTRIRQIESADPQHRSFERIFAALTVDYGTYTALRSLIESAQQTEGPLAERLEEARAAKAASEARIAALEEERAQLEEILASEETAPEDASAAQERLTELDQELARAQVDVEAQTRLIEGYEALIERAGSEDAQKRLDEIDAAYGGSVAAAFSEYSKLEQDRMLAEALQREKSLVDTAISRIRGEITDAERQIEEGKKELEAGREEYQKALTKFDLEIEKAETELRKAQQDLDELPAAGWTVLTRESHYASYMYKNNAAQMGAIGIALPVLFYLVAALVCLTTMTRLVDEQRGQIGLLRALGFSVGRVAMRYVFYAVVAALLGSVVGIAAGMAVFPTVIYNTWRLLYDLPPMILTFPIRYVLISLGAFTLLMAAVTYIVARRSLREVPSQLMRPRAPKSAKRIFLERFTGFWNHLSFTSKVTARNLVRYKGRFIMTVIGVAGCTALLVVGWGIKDSIGDIVAIQYGDILDYQYSVALEPDTDPQPFLDLLQENLDNEKTVPLRTYASRVYLADGDATINAVVMDAREANDLLNLRATDHRTPIKLRSGGAIVSEKFARTHGLSAGDRIVMESASGLKAEVKVDAVCEMYFQHYLFLAADAYESLFSEKFHPQTIAVRNRAGNLDEAALEKLEGFESLTDFSGVIDQFNTMIQALDFIILVIILTAGALAFVVLMSLTQVNLSERVREIATLKVLGFRRGEVISYIFREIFLLSLIGALCGLPLGVLEHRFIMNVITMEMIQFGMNIKPLSFALAFGVTLVFTLIVLFLMRRPIRRVEMVESLKSVE